MLGAVLRSRALARPASVRVLTRSIPAVSAIVHASPFSTPRTFANSAVARDDGYGERRAYQSMDSDAGYARPSRPPKDPSETLYIGNLPFTVTKEEVEQLFEEYGEIKGVRLAVFPSGESKGFAHIDFGNIETAQRVMDANLESQFILEGRDLRLDWAGPVSRPANPPSANLYFSNYDGDEALLEDALAEYKDNIQAIRLMRDPRTNDSNRFGFIDCISVEDATQLLEKLNGSEIEDGQKFQVAFARPRNEAPRFSYGGRGGGYGDGERGGGGFRGGDRGRDEGGYRQRQDFGGGGRGGYSRGGGRGRGNDSYRGRDQGSYPGRDEGSNRGAFYGGRRGGGYGE